MLLIWLKKQNNLLKNFVRLLQNYMVWLEIHMLNLENTIVH